MCDESIEEKSEGKVKELLEDLDEKKARIIELEIDNEDLKHILTELSSRYDQIKKVIGGIAA